MIRRRIYTQPSWYVPPATSGSTIPDGSISTAKLGVDITTAGKALLDDADVATQRATLGLGTAATSAATAFAASAHGHAIVDTTGLQAALDGKQAAGSYAAATHTHTAGQVSGLAMVATSGSAADLTGTLAAASLPLVTAAANGAVPANMGTKASLSAAKPIANTLTQVVGYTAAAGTLKVGTVIRFQAMGLQTNSTTASTSVITLRINATSLGTVIEASWSCAMGTAARTNCPFYIDGEIVVRSVGTGGAGAGQAQGVLLVSNNGLAYAAPTTTVTAAVNVNTTVSNVVEMTTISGAASTTWNYISATIEIVQP